MRETFTAANIESHLIGYERLLALFKEIQKQTPKGHEDLVLTLAISPDGKTLVSGSTDKTIKIWRLP